MKKFFVFILLMLLAHPLFSETRLGAGFSGNFDPAETSFFYPEIWAAGGTDHLFYINDHTSAYLQIDGSAEHIWNIGLFSWQAGFTGDLSFEKRLSVLQPALTLLFFGEIADSGGAASGFYGKADFKHLWGTLETSYSINPGVFLDMEEKNAIGLDFSFRASRLLPEDLTLSLNLLGGYTLPWQYTGFHLNPRLTLSWFAPGLKIFAAELGFTLSSYTLEEEIKPDLFVTSRSFKEGNLVLSAALPFGNNLRLSAEAPVSVSLKDHPAVQEGSLLGEEEWTVSLQPKAVLGVPLKGGGYLSFSLEILKIFSNSDYQRSFSITSEISFDYSF